MRKLPPALGTMATLLFSLGSPARAAILTVDSNADNTVVNADCTLREALIEASRIAGLAVYTECGNPTIGAGDTVLFDASLQGDTIVVLSTLEIELDTGTTIDAVGRKILLDGSLLADPVILVTATGTGVRGLTIVGGTYGIELLAADNCFIGAAALSDGNIIREGAVGGIIASNGVGNDFQYNTIIDNENAGIWVFGEVDAVIRGNRIGIDGASNVVPNGEGVFINTGEVALTDNVISGNIGAGARIVDGTATMTGNRIGLDPTGALAKRNGGHGVHVQDGANVTIGGTSQADRNWIGANGSAGVYVNGATSVVELQLNRIGTNSGGTAAIGNLDGVWIANVADATLIQNLISGNSRYGVQLDVGEATLVNNRIGVTPAMAALPNGTAGIRTSDAMLLERNVIAFHSGVGDVGLHVEPGGDLLAGSEENCITGNTIGLYDDTSLDISIENSWWGNASGPSDVGGGTGDPLTLNDAFGVTDYSPVQAAPTVNCP